MPNSKYQLEDFLNTVHQDDRDFVMQIHEQLLREGYKPKVQLTKLYGLHVQYWQPRIKTVKGIIAYLMVHEGHLRIRINMDNHAKYSDALEHLPESMVCSIDASPDCMKMADPTKCWQGCIGYAFEIGGKSFGKCYCCCFVFDINAANFPTITELLTYEDEQRQAIFQL